MVGTVEFPNLIGQNVSRVAQAGVLAIIQHGLILILTPKDLYCTSDILEGK